MQHLLTNITGLDMALCLALLLVYVWYTPTGEESTQALDTNAAD